MAAMNVKRWLAWLFIGLLLVSEIGFFVVNQQRSTAQAGWRASRLEVSQLQDQLDQYQNSSAVTQSNELARVRKQNETLAQKLASAQNSINLLRATNQLISQQLETAAGYLQQQQGQLDQFAVENQRARAAAQAAQATQAARSDAQIATAQRNACINNLRQIDAAKNQWALENSKTATDVPALNDITPYLKDGIFPVVSRRRTLFHQRRGRSADLFGARPCAAAITQLGSFSFLAFAAASLHSAFHD